MKRRAGVVVAALVLAVANPGFAQQPSRADDPVRAITPELRSVVDLGYEHSPTFRSIVDGLAGSFVIVHLVPSASLPSDLVGGLQFVTTAAGYRYLRVSMRTDLGLAELIAALGHELQHAFEIGQAPAVVDAVTLREFYRVTGVESCLDSSHECYDTLGAQTMGHSVYTELLSGSPLQVPQRRRAEVPGW